MKNKKLISLLLAASLVFGLTACGADTSKNDDDRDSERATTTAAEEEEDDTETSSETTTEAPDLTESTEATLREPTGPVESECFTDFDNMSFTYNGHTYTLGVTTLQDLIDDGVDLSGSNNFDTILDGQTNLAAGFSFELIPYRLATVSVANYTDDSLPATECVLDSFRVSNLREIPEGTIGFNFPDMFTKEDLLNCAGEPDEQTDFTGDDGVLQETVTYRMDSEIYMASRGYTYTFKDGILDGITMSYVP